MPSAAKPQSESRPDVLTASIIVAGGSGQRFGGFKQYEQLRGRRVLDYSLDAARAACDFVVLVVPDAVADRAEPFADIVVAGGKTRSESVRAGIEVIPSGCEVIVVHDAVRPLAGAELFERVVDAVRGGADAAIPGVDVVDTLRRRDGSSMSSQRHELVAVQTPQAFAASTLRQVHASGHAEATDDASLVSQAGGHVVIVPGERNNLKITEPLDLTIATVLVGEKTATRPADAESTGDGATGEEERDG